MQKSVHNSSCQQITNHIINLKRQISKAQACKVSLVNILSSKVVKLSQIKRILILLLGENGLKGYGICLKKCAMSHSFSSTRTLWAPNCKEGISSPILEPARSLNKCRTSSGPEIPPSAEVRTRRCTNASRLSIG